jgi:transcriptional regulator with XRE-family HTH domain
MKRYTIKEAREKSGLSKAEVSKRMGIKSVCTWYNKESYRRSLSGGELLSFAKIVGISPDSIIRKDERS